MTLWLKRALLCAVFAGGVLVIGAASALADEPATDAGLGAEVSADLEADVDLLGDPCSCGDDALLDADIDLDVEADVDLALGHRGGACRCEGAGDDGDAAAADPDDGADPTPGSNGGAGGNGTGDEVGGSEVHSPSPGGNGAGDGGGTGDGTGDVMDQMTDVEGIDTVNVDGEDGEDGNGDDGNGDGNGGDDVDRDIVADCSVTNGCLVCLRILNRNLAALLVDVHDEVRIEARIGFLDDRCSRHDTDLIHADADLDVKADVDADVSAQVDADVDAEVDADVEAEFDLLDDRCRSCGGGSLIDADADLDVKADVEDGVGAQVEADVDAEVDLLDEPCEGDGKLLDLTVG